MELAGEGATDADNSWLDFVLYSGNDSSYWDFATAYTYEGVEVYGPTYTSPFVLCARSEFGNVKAAMLAVAQYIAGMSVSVATSQGITTAVRQAAILLETYPEDAEYLAAFISVLVAAVSPEVIASLLVAAGVGALGVTVALLLQYLSCVAFGA